MIPNNRQWMIWAVSHHKFKSKWKVNRSQLMLRVDQTNSSIRYRCKTMARWCNKIWTVSRSWWISNRCNNNNNKCKWTQTWWILISSKWRCNNRWKCRNNKSWCKVKTQISTISTPLKLTSSKCPTNSRSKLECRIIR